MSDGRTYLLVKRGLYYRPDRCGYTGIKARAGRYFQGDASPACHVEAVHESHAPEYAPGCFPDLAAADFAERVRALSAALADLLSGRAIIPASVDERPQGQDGADRLGAEPASAVPEEADATPSSPLPNTGA